MPCASSVASQSTNVKARRVCSPHLEQNEASPGTVSGALRCWRCRAGRAASSVGPSRAGAPTALQRRTRAAAAGCSRHALHCPAARRGSAPASGTRGGCTEVGPLLHSVRIELHAGPKDGPASFQFGAIFGAEKNLVPSYQKNSHFGAALEQYMCNFGEIWYSCLLGMMACIHVTSCVMPIKNPKLAVILYY